MRTFVSAAPGVLWVAILVGLNAGAAWLAEFYGNLEWVPPVVGFLTIVAIPLLKVIAYGDEPVGVRGGEVTAYRSKFSRWLW